MEPVIDVLASEHQGKAKVGKLDAMSNLTSAMRYHIRALPTLLLFKGGNVVWQRTGVIDKVELQQLLDPHL